MPKQKVSANYIIKQSLKVFRNKGYYNTSMKDIADACGLLKGSLYHYFSSKEALMKTVIEHLHKYYQKEVFAHAYDETLNAKQKLQRLSEISEQQFLGSDDGCLMGNLALETASTIPTFSKLIQQFFQEWIDALAHIFQETLQPSNALTLAQKSVADIEGAIMMMRLFNNSDFLKQTHLSIMENWERLGKRDN